MIQELFDRNIYASLSNAQLCAMVEWTQCIVTSLNHNNQWFSDSRREDKSCSLPRDKRETRYSLCLHNAGYLKETTKLDDDTHTNEMTQKKP